MTPSEIPQKEAVIKEVGEKTKNTNETSKNASELQAQTITTENLKTFFEKSLATETTPEDKDAIQKAFANAVTEIANKYEDSGITEQQIRAWIFGESLKSTELTSLTLDDNKKLDATSTDTEKIKSLNTILFKLGFLKELKEPEKYSTETENAVKALKKSLNISLSLTEQDKLDENEDSFDKKTLTKLTEFITKETATPEPPAEPEETPAPVAAPGAETVAPTEPAPETTGNFLNFATLKTTVENLNIDKGLAGTKGPQVESLQKILYSISVLYKINCKPGEFGTLQDGIDGRYGSVTKTAVQTLQEAILKAYNETEDKAKTSKWGETFATDTKITDANFADGNFGPQTLIALKKFLELTPPGSADAPGPAPAAEAQAAEAPAAEATVAEAPAANVSATATTEAPEAAPEINTNRIQANFDRLMSKQSEMAEDQPFIYEQHPEILLWVAASEYGDTAQKVSIENSYSNPRTIILKIKIPEGIIYAPPSVGEKYISMGESKEEQLATLKQMLLLGPTEKKAADEIFKTRKEIPRVTFDGKLNEKYQKASKSPDFQGFNSLQIGETPDADASIESGITEFAQKVLGLKIKPKTGEATKKVIAYLNKMAAGTQAMDKAISALGDAALKSKDPALQKASILPSGMPITPEDKALMLQAFMEDNKVLLEQIYITQAACEKKLLSLSGNPNLPPNTVIAYTTSEGGTPSADRAAGLPKILLPASYKVTLDPGNKIEYKKVLDFNDCTETVIKELEITKKGDKTIIKTTELSVADLENGNPAQTIEKTYTLEKPKEEAEESALSHETPSDVQALCKIDVSDSDMKKGAEAERKFERKYDEWDEQIRISLPADSQKYVTLDLDVKSDKEFEKGEWIESKVRALTLKDKNRTIGKIKSKVPTFNIDKPTQILKYTEEHDASKIGYIIFDTESRKVITVSNNGDVEAFDLSSGGLDQTKIFLGEDPSHLKDLAATLPIPLKEDLQSANLSGIDKIAIDGIDANGLTKTLGELAKQALGKADFSAKKYDEKSSPELYEFAKELLERSKDHKSIILSSAYKQIVVAAFMADNKESLQTLKTAEISRKEADETAKKLEAEKARYGEIIVKNLNGTITLDAPPTGESISVETATTKLHELILESLNKGKKEGQTLVIPPAYTESSALTQFVKTKVIIANRQYTEKTTLSFSETNLEEMTKAFLQDNHEALGIENPAPAVADPVAPAAEPVAAPATAEVTSTPVPVETVPVPEAVLTPTPPKPAPPEAEPAPAPVADDNPPIIAPIEAPAEPKPAPSATKVETTESGEILMENVSEQTLVEEGILDPDFKDIVNKNKPKTQQLSIAITAVINKARNIHALKETLKKETGEEKQKKIKTEIENIITQTNNLYGPVLKSPIDTPSPAATVTAPAEVTAPDTEIQAKKIESLQTRLKQKGSEIFSGELASLNTDGNCKTLAKNLVEKGYDESSQIHISAEKGRNNIVAVYITIDGQPRIKGLAYNNNFQSAFAEACTEIKFKSDSFTPESRAKMTKLNEELTKSSPLPKDIDSPVNRLRLARVLTEKGYEIADLTNLKFKAETSTDPYNSKIYWILGRFDGEEISSPPPHGTKQIKGGDYGNFENAFLRLLRNIPYNYQS